MLEKTKMFYRRDSADLGLDIPAIKPEPFTRGYDDIRALAPPAPVPQADLMSTPVSALIP